MSTTNANNVAFVMLFVQNMLYSLNYNITERTKLLLTITNV